MIAALAIALFVLAVIVAASAVIAFKNLPRLTPAQGAWVGIPILVAILCVGVYRSTQGSPAPATTASPAVAIASSAASAALPVAVASTAATPDEPEATPGAAATAAKRSGTPPVAVAAAAAPNLNGKALFAANCAACHQLTGLGLPGTFPPLAGSEVPNGPATQHIKFVLGGHSGPLEVQEKQFNGVMPAFKGQLSAPVIAAILTYERTSWGNHGGPVTAAQVAALGG